MSFPDIFTTVVVSTAHLPAELAKAMDDQSDLGSFAYETVAYGYRVYTNGDDIPDAIKEIVTAAKHAGAKYIEFDCDGPKLADFPTWEW